MPSCLFQCSECVSIEGAFAALGSAALILCVTVVIHCRQSLLDASNPTCLLWPQSSKQWQDYIFYSNIQQFSSNIIPRLIKPFWELTLIFKEEKTKSCLLGFVALLHRMKEDVFHAGPPTCLWFYFHCRHSFHKRMKNAKRKQLFSLGLIIFLNASVGFWWAAIYNVLYFIFMKHLCNKDKVFN